MKKLLLIPFLLVAFCIPGRTQAPTVLTDLLDHTLDSMRTKLGAKGLGAAIYFPDNSIWAGASGISSANPNVDITTDDAFLIGSVTKTITSACILQLADEGLITLEDSLGMWLDTLPVIDPNGYINRKVTIRQLLRHQSGIYDVLSHPNNQPTLLSDISQIWTPEALIKEFISPALFAPGATWSYSNTNYFLLAMIIKKVTGQPFYEVYRERFFEPLDLQEIAIPAFEPLLPPVAHVWLDITGDGITDDANDFYMSYMALNSTAGAAGGYFSTPRDLAKWTSTYLRGDLVSPALMAEAKTMVVAPGQPITYGLGLMRKMFIGQEAFGHGGDLAYAASAWYFPAKDISIVVMTNDSKKNSWTLIPTVAALLKNYLDYCMSVGVVENAEVENRVLEAFPNPFGDALTVSIELPAATDEVQLLLTDPLGRTLETIRRDNLPAGNSLFEFGQLTQLPPGIYFIRALVDGRHLGTVKVSKPF